MVLAAITSCTNTSNPGVMLGAGLLAKSAFEKGLSVKPYIKTSLSPGSGVVDRYLKESNLLPFFEQLGFYTTGFGCQSCIGNSGELDEEVAEAITSKDLVVGAVLSGNRNFEGRVHPLTRANYLASPPLVVAYLSENYTDFTLVARHALLDFLEYHQHITRFRSANFWKENASFSFTQVRPRWSARHRF